MKREVDMVDDILDSWFFFIVFKKRLEEEDRRVKWIRMLFYDVNDFMYFDVGIYGSCSCYFFIFVLIFRVCVVNYNMDFYCYIGERLKVLFI